MTHTISLSALKKYVRASNYLAVAQIYLQKNILLTSPLEFADIKPRLLGHWGTCPGINFVYAHTNKLIQEEDASMLYIVGPGHGFPAIQANLFIEKSLSHFYPEKIPYTEEGIQEICSKFSAPYGYPSHSNPAAPGAILEGGELGYSLSIAYGTVLDNKDLITVCLVGDGEAETGPLATAWHINKILSPKENGAVLPIIHINGYKISGPTFLGRMSDEEIQHLFSGYGYEVHIVDYEKSEDVYKAMADTMKACYQKIRSIQNKARSGEIVEKPQWPMIALKTPKGWTGVHEADGNLLEGNCLSHQVIMGDVQKNREHLELLESWLQSYKFTELFSQNDQGEIVWDKEFASLIPELHKSCGTNPKAYGGEICKPLNLPDISHFHSPSIVEDDKNDNNPMKVAGKFFQEILQNNKSKENFRIFSPDETYSNKIDAVFTETARSWQWPIKEFDTDLKREGKVLEMLSEHSLFGLMHGYTVTGRFGVFVSYEAFVQVVASMADQYAKFIKASLKVPFRKPLPAMNVILTSLLERQDHNGFSHQNPSFIASMLEKDGNIIEAFFPPEGHCMYYTLKDAFESRNALNVIVAGKNETPVWLSPDEAKKQMEDGILIWDFASNEDPDIVVAASGDYATIESLAGISMCKMLLPHIKVRFVNVSRMNADGLGSKTVQTQEEYLDTYFTNNKPVIYNFHGYPHTIKKLVFDYHGAQRIKINGYTEEGSTTTPFDMELRNGSSRYHTVLDIVGALQKNKQISTKEAQEVKEYISSKIQKHHAYILQYGIDPEEISDWRWKA